MQPKPIKIIFCASIACLFYISNADAQKLPAVQLISIQAPANIKIDGKATEWGDKFQAYNNHVEFFYTISNDNTNLYLTVQATKHNTIRRIMNAGLTLLVNPDSKKSAKSGMTVTFPLFENKEFFTARFSPDGPTKTNYGAPGAGQGGGSSIGSTGVGRRTLPPGIVGGFTTSQGSYQVTSDGQIIPIWLAGEAPDGKPVSPAQADSLMKVNNANFSTKAKLIGLKGFKDIDSTISVYNQDGIKAVGAFDNNLAYTYELAIPLKYFGFKASEAPKFSYQIMVNELAQKGINVSVGDGRTSIGTTDGAQMGQAATDFWGEYTIAKK